MSASSSAGLKDEHASVEALKLADRGRVVPKIGEEAITLAAAELRRRAGDGSTHGS